MEQDERKNFDNLLNADEPGKMSRGTDLLMKVMGGRMPPRAPEGVT